MLQPQIRIVTLKDLATCFHIESEAYTGDEAASLHKIEKRIREYPEGFLVRFVSNTP